MTVLGTTTRWFVLLWSSSFAIRLDIRLYRTRQGLLDRNQGYYQVNHIGAVYRLPSLKLLFVVHTISVFMDGCYRCLKSALLPRRRQIQVKPNIFVQLPTISHLPSLSIVLDLMSRILYFPEALWLVIHVL